jgi:hypothetical protein
VASLRFHHRLPSVAPTGAFARARHPTWGVRSQDWIQKPPLFQLDTNLCAVSCHSVAAPRASFALDDTWSRATPVLDDT